MEDTGVATRLPSRLDMALAAALCIGVLVEIALTDVEGPLWLVVATAVGMTAPLAWRRQFPFAVAAVGALAFAVSELVSGSLSELVSPFVAIVVTVYSVGAHLPLDRALVAGAAELLSVWLSVVEDEGGADVSSVAYATLVVVGAWCLGRPVYARQSRVHALESEAAQSARRQEVAVAEASAAERARLSRELHDLLGHSLTVMVVQAAGAEEVLGTSPETARRALNDVQRTGREALAELRHTLALLQEGPPSDEPAPGWDGLSPLLRAAEAAGLDARLDVDTGVGPVSPGVQWCVHRVVQEAVTNVIRHAQARRLDITVRRRGSDLVVDVCDDGRGSGSHLVEGLGLTGMRERLAAYGGRLEVQTSADGGVQLQAVLPAGDAA